MVNLAARLREKAAPGQILVGETVYRHTRRAFAFARQEVQAKGFAEPVAAYEVVRALSRPEKVRGIEGLRAMMIGREHELAQLTEALAEVRAGRGQIATIVGEAGVGKSRLIAELKEAALTPQEGQPVPLWLEGRCLDVGMTASYWPFLDLLHTYCGLVPEEDERERGERIAASLQALVARGSLTTARCEELLPLLGNLLAARFGSALDGRLAHAGPEQIKHQTFLALRDLVIALAQTQPVVLILEDLHWADALSLDLISLLMETLTLVPLFLVCVYRPEREHKCWHLAAIATRKSHERFTEIHLKELTTHQSRRLVESLLHIDALPAVVKEQILAKTQGNPFFVEEVVRSLIDSGLVYHDGTVWRAREEISSLAVPESVQSVILSRVDRLDGEVKHVLQSAAVIGRLFQRRLLGQFSQKEAVLEHALQQLEDRQLIYQERAIPEEEYSFEHVLTQETVYQNILRRRRAVFHQQVAEGIEVLYAESLENYYDQLAYHYDQTGAVEKAVEYLLRAGEKARRNYLNDQAGGYFRRALQQLVIAGDRDTHRYKAWRMGAHTGLGRVHRAVGEWEPAVTHLQEAITLAEQLDVPVQHQVRLLQWLGHLRWSQGRTEDALAVGERGLALLGDATESAEAAMMNDLMVMGYAFRGDRHTAWTLIQRNAQILPHVPYCEELGSAYDDVAMLTLDWGKDVEEAARWVDLLATRGRQAHDQRAVGEAERVGAQILEQTGDLRAALPAWQQASNTAQRIGDPVEHNRLMAVVVVALQLGDLDTAEEYLRRGLAIAQHVGVQGVDPGVALELRSYLALCHSLLEQARDDLQESVHSGWSGGLWYGDGVRVLLLGRVHLAVGDVVEAANQMEAAIPSLQLGVMSLNHLSSFTLGNALSGIEEATGSTPYVRDLVERLRREHPTARTLLVSPCLVPAEVDSFPHRHVWEPFGGPLSPAWNWHDPYGDCRYSPDDGLLLHAANGRDLWHVNLSAPRLLQPTPGGDYSVQTVCTTVSDEQPAIGGLLLWQDEQNYVVLERGRWGRADNAFRGCLDNEDCFLGRGRLPAERMWLRLERQGDRVRALCSADGQEWFTAGEVEFPHREGEQIGVHAIGMIDRTIYHGAFPEGTAIRFESFKLWTASPD